QASKDLSSVSLFVRITRGRHMVESAAVASRLLPSGGGGGGGTEIMKDAEDGKAIWVWRWDEVLALPGPSEDVPLGLPRIVGGDEVVQHTAVCPAGEEGGPGDERRVEKDVVDDPLAATASSTEERQWYPETETPDTNAMDSAREEDSALNDVDSRAAVERGLQDDDDSCSIESYPSSSETDSSSVIATAERNQKQEKARVEFAPDMTRSDGNPLATPGGVKGTTARKASVLAKLPQRGSGGAKAKRGVSFWSPTRGRGKTNASGARSAVTGTRDSSTADTAARRATVAATDNIPGNVESSGDPNTDSVESDAPDAVDSSIPQDQSWAKNGDKEDTEEASGGSTGDSVNSEDSAAGKEEVDTAESPGGMFRKRGLSFWSPRRGTRKQISTTTATVTLRSDDGSTDGTGAGSTTPRVTVATADDIQGDIEPSSDPNIGSHFESDAPAVVHASIPQDHGWPKNGDKKGTEEVGSGSAGDSVNSENSRLNTPPGTDGSTAAGDEVVATKPAGGMLNRRKLSFWSPRRGRRKPASNTTVTTIPRSDVGHTDGTAADATIPRVTVATADDFQDDIEPAGHSNTDRSVESDAPGVVDTSIPQDQSWPNCEDKEHTEEASGGSTGDSVNSENSRPSTPPGIDDGSAADEEEVDATKSAGGMLNRRKLSFWSPRRLRRKQTSTTTATAIPRSDVGSTEGTAAGVTTPRVTVAATDDIPGDGESSGDPNTDSNVERHVRGVVNTNWTTNGEQDDKEEAGGGSTGDPINSDDNCLYTQANVKGKMTIKPSALAKRPRSFSGGAKLKRRVSFWSPTRGRRKKDASFAGGKAVGRSDGTTEDATTPHVTVEAADSISGNVKPSGDPNVDCSVEWGAPGVVDTTIPHGKHWTKSGDREDTEEASVESTGDSVNSENSCPSTPPGTNDGSTAAGDEVVATKPASGMLNRRKLSFWSPRRGRRKQTETTITAIPNSNVGTSNCCGSEAASTTADNADGALDKVSSDDESRNDSDDSESGNESSAVTDEHALSDRFWPKSIGEENTRGASSEDADPPDESCSEFSVKAADTAVGGGAMAECPDPGETRKIGARFWSPRGERKKGIPSDAIAPGGACGREESTTAMGTSDPQESDRKARAVPGEADSVAPGSLLKRAGASLWSPRSKGGSGPTGKPRHTNEKYDGPVEVRRREQAGGPAALEEPSPPDVLVLEVWETNTPAALHPYTAQDPTTGAPGRQRGVQSTHSHNRTENNSDSSLDLDAVAGDSDQRARRPQDQRQPVVTMDKSRGGVSPTSADNLRDSGAERGGITDCNDAKLDTDSSTPRRACADDDHHVSVVDGGVSVADDEASAASAATAENMRRRNPTLLLSPFKGRKKKKQDQSSLTSSELPLSSSETEATGDPGLDGGKDPPQAPVSDGGKSGSEEDDDGEDEDVSFATFPSGISAAIETSPPKKARGSVFTIPFKGGRRNKTSTQQQLAESTGRSASTPRAKPVLWGRLRIPVEGTILTRDKEIADTNVERAETALHALGGSTGTTGMATVGISANQTSTSERGSGSSCVFGVSVPGLDSKKKKTKDEADSLARGAARVRVAGGTPSRSPPRSVFPCVDGWFEVGYPKGTRGKKVKGMVRLTLTPCG
ncbi:unnamed protein product, partial [Ectocarpus fasciculatus]